MLDSLVKSKSDHKARVDYYMNALKSEVKLNNN